MENVIKDKVAYEINHRGYTFTATYLVEPKADALIEIKKDNKTVKEFLFPAYKIFNMPAHKDDIIDGLEENSDAGLKVAGSNGLGGNSYQGQYGTS